MTFKEKIYEIYCGIIEDKIRLLQNALAELKESSSNETKSTAGDKYETALAMLHLEQENTHQQLNEALKQKALLGTIVPNTSSSKIGNGSLVKTNKGYFFLCVALGKITVEEKTIIALSAHSPLGQKMTGLGVDDSVEMNDVHYKIESIA